MSANGAEILANICQFVSGNGDPSTTQLVLIWAAVVGGILVGWGIIWEAWRDGHLWTLPTTCVIFGVIIEASATIFLFEFDERTIRSQNDKIIALDTRLMPRHLSGDKRDKFIAEMEVFSGTKFAVSTGGASEPEIFAIEVADALKAAGWDWVNWPLGGVATNPPEGRPQMGLDLMAGIEVHIFDPFHEPLAVGLYQALVDAGFTNHWILSPSDARAPDIIIIVGSKE
jgi:hypothetical protein